MPRRLIACISALVLLAGVPPAHAGAPDPYLPRQWALATIGAAQAWPRARGAGITIAVVDSGINASHQDLAGKILPGTACFNTAGDPSACQGSSADDDGHGTHVAGIAAAYEGNSVGIAGVAPDAKILPVRVLRHNCQPQVDSGQFCEATGTTDDLRAGIRWAVDHGADIVNLSIGPDVASIVLKGLPIADAVNYAWNRGAIVVVAAGNDFNATIGDGYDHLPLVIVAATDRQDQLAVYSNNVGNVRWGIAAPGGAGPQGTCPDTDILSTYTGSSNAYTCMWGTSMAAPHVSGALALLRSAGLSPSDAIGRLMSTANTLGMTVPNSTFGFGRLDLARAFAGLTLPSAPVPPQAIHGLGGSAPTPGPAGSSSLASPAPAASGQGAKPAAAPRTAESARPARPPGPAVALPRHLPFRHRLVWWPWPAIAAILLLAAGLRAVKRLRGKGSRPTAE